MRILITGKGGSSGSWKVRGEQLGAAIGADVNPLCTNFREYDLIVVVKRTPHQVINAIQASGKPWVYDVVDGWPQGGRIGMGKTEALRWLRTQLAQLSPTAVVFGTETMRADAEFEGPGLVLPHHSWQRYMDREPTIREHVQVVGYEGGAQYLGRWHGILQRECQARGWDFHINGDMGEADIGVALRDAGGYPARHWKPGTKLSNLQALGIPALCSPEDGAQSVASGAEFWINADQDVVDALDYLTDYHARLRISTRMRPAAIPLKLAADTYLQWLQTL